MKARVNPPCGINDLFRDLTKMMQEQEKQKKQRKPRPEWSRRGVR